MVWHSQSVLYSKPSEQRKKGSSCEWDGGGDEKTLDRLLLELRFTSLILAFSKWMNWKWFRRNSASSVVRVNCLCFTFQFRVIYVRVVGTKHSFDSHAIFYAVIFCSSLPLPQRCTSRIQRWMRNEYDTQSNHAELIDSRFGVTCQSNCRRGASVPCIPALGLIEFIWGLVRSSF